MTSRDDIMERARAMVPVLRERAQDTERLRRLPEETHGDFLEAGFYRVLQPAAFGGLELDFGTQTELAVELGAGCGSSAWVASVIASRLAGGHVFSRDPGGGVGGGFQRRCRLFFSAFWARYSKGEGRRPGFRQMGVF